MQILAEHAYTLYLGGRLPPDLWAGYEWTEEFPAEPKPSYLSSKPRQFAVRIPRALHRRIRVWAVKADISDQDLAVRVFDWYVRKELYPPYRDQVRRGTRGELIVDEPMLADEFEGYSEDQYMRVLDIMVERHNKYGGPLADKTPDGRPINHVSAWQLVHDKSFGMRDEIVRWGKEHPARKRPARSRESGRD